MKNKQGKYDAMMKALVLIVLIPVVVCNDAKTIQKSNKSFFTHVHTSDTESEEFQLVRSKRASGGFDNNQKTTLVEEHNRHRSDVDPPATDMQYMSWDDNLASMAQTWSENCTWEHGNPPNTSPFGWVGQNLWMGAPYAADSVVDVSSVVQSWYNEVNDYTYDANSCSNVCGHYTQVVWASSYKVGCGVAHCPTVNGASMTNALLVTCNYGPGGNYQGVKPYAQGQPCTQCEGSNPDCYTNLCVNCTEQSLQCDGQSPTDTSTVADGQLQDDSEQSAHGIKLKIKGTVIEYPSIESLLLSAVADAFNKYCNNEFEVCCPGKGTKTNQAFLPFMVVSNILTANGYPVEDDNGNINYWTMLVALSSADNELCNAGMKRKKRTTDGEVMYVDQEIFFAVLEASLESIQNVTGLVIVALERGSVITDHTEHGMEIWVIAVVVVFVLLIIASVIIAVIIVLVKKPALLGRKAAKTSSKVNVVEDKSSEKMAISN